MVIGGYRMVVTDNGGATAIKGFNYQKASLILVIIKNFQKENFSVIPESREDFEINLDNRRFFIQVKGTKKLSWNNLSKNDKKDLSILEKNIHPGEDDDIRKLFLWSLTDSTKKELEEVYNSSLVEPIYSFSDEIREKIIKKLNLNSKQIDRFNNQYLYITPFENDLTIALTYLKGVMIDEGIVTDNIRTNILLGNLSILIDKKSEVDIKTYNDVDKKTISGNYLRTLFTTNEQKNKFEKVLENLDMNQLKKTLIRNSKTKIPLLYQTLKQKLKSKINVQSLINLPENEVLDIIIDNAKELSDNDIKDEQLWALAIDCYCELGDDLCDN